MKKPARIREEIKNIKEQKAVEDVLIKTYTRYKDERNYQERIGTQLAIITEAWLTIDIIQQEYENANTEIEKITKNAKYDDKRLAVLKNHEKIEKLKAIIVQLQEVENGEKYDN